MPSRGQLSRRELLKHSLATGAAGCIAGSAIATEPTSRPVNADSDRPRNIIFMVADGMSTGVPSLAQPFSRLVRGCGTQYYELCNARDTARGFFETWSLSSLVTDSAAASTAWGSGSRVFNSAVNMLPDGTRLTPLAHLVRDSGRRIGLVTTTTITHATPAGFAAVQSSREDQHLIAPQYLGLVDVLLGGGRKHFDADQRADKRNLIAEFQATGYAFCDQRAKLVGQTPPPRLLGLFADGHIPFSLDRMNTPKLLERVPTLAEMTQTALDILGGGDRGFLLQVEGGRVDHAAHSNDAAALLWEQLAFDDAIAVVRTFAEKRGDTLVVITTDHGNSNPGLNGMGEDYRDSNACFEALAAAKASFEVLEKWFEKHVTEPSAVGSAAGRAAAGRDETIERIRAATGVEIKPFQADALLASARTDRPDELNRQHAGLVGTLGEILGNTNGVGWTGTSHTADLALVLAFGPGRGQFAGLLRNADAFARITELLDIRHVNPTMSPPESRKYMATAPRIRTPDNYA